MTEDIPTVDGMLAYGIEYSRSGRAKCKLCKDPIAQVSAFFLLLRCPLLIAFFREFCACVSAKRRNTTMESKRIGKQYLFDSTKQELDF